MTWAERAAEDASLRDFVAAEIARAGIAVDTAKYNEQHWKTVADRLQDKLTALQRKAKEKK